jgi:aryl-alcohol dehydrogenase-like predicted oxidoreductase
MELRMIGRSGLKVSPLCLGGNVFGMVPTRIIRHYSEAPPAPFPADHSAWCGS